MTGYFEKFGHSVPSGFVLLCFMSYLNLCISFSFPRPVNRESFQLSIASCDLATEGSIPCVATSELNAPPQSVWTVFGDLAAKTGAYNLGQGFPDWNPPQVR